MNSTRLSRGYSILSSFIPLYKPFDAHLITELQLRLNNIPRLLILTGAGVSTESGIPDYRSEKVGRFFTSKSRPVQLAEFVKDADVRRRFWARNFVGWTTFSKFAPNPVHYSVAGWEHQEHGRLHWLITQNVDDLHRKAGSRNVTELHGSAFNVHCLKCNFSTDRRSFQSFLTNLNPNFDINAVQIAPDGDVDLTTDVISTDSSKNCFYIAKNSIQDNVDSQRKQMASFVGPKCPKCESDLVKPNIVFFGDNVSKDTVEFCYDKVDTADGMLVLGSSLQVYSGFRFVKRMSERNRPIMIINIGPTRGDEYANLKLATKCGDVVPLMKMSKVDPISLPKFVNKK